MNLRGAALDLRVWIAGALVLALLSGTIDVPFSTLIVIALMIQMALSMDGLRLSPGDLIENRRAAIRSLVMCYVINTGVTLGIGSVFLFGYEAMWHGWVLLASMPCAISVVTAAILVKGDLNAAVIAVAATYIAGLLLTPLISFVFLGNAVSPAEIFKYIILFIAIPAAASVPLGKLHLSRNVKVPVINFMMALILFLSVNSNRGYIIAYPLAIAAVLIAAAARLGLLSVISKKLNRIAGIEGRSSAVYLVLCVWKNTGLSISMCMVLLADTPESVIPCFVCMIIESLWFSVVTKEPGPDHSK